MSTPLFAVTLIGYGAASRRNGVAAGEAGLPLGLDVNTGY